MIASLKRSGPTPMNSSQLPPKGETYEDQVEEEEEEEEDPLQQQFKTLEQEWSFYKQLNPRNGRCSTESSVTEDYLQLLTENSPPDLMSSLQHRRRVPSQGYLCNWRQNDRAAVEILKDRWDAIDSGKLKGRRLFEDLSSGEATEEDICSECYNLVQESEGGLLSSCGSDGGEHENENGVGNCKERLGSDLCYCYSSSSSSESEERVLGGEEAKVEVKSGIGGGMVGYGKIWLGVIIAWVGVVFAICIVSGKFNGGYVEEVMLVPT